MKPGFFLAGTNELTNFRKIVPIDCQACGKARCNDGKLGLSRREFLVQMARASAGLPLVSAPALAGAEILPPFRP